MKLIVGLGNPGKKYEKTRHNCGFLVVDQFAEMAKIDLEREGFKSVYGKGKILDEDVVIAKPQTFMNNSGEAVVELVNFFKVSIEDIIVVFDDMAIKPGEIRLREKGSSGGQKGMQSIINLLGTQDIKRLRVGIGEPQFNSIDYVLGKPSSEEEPLFLDAFEKACNALKAVFQHNFHYAMSSFN